MPIFLARSCSVAGIILYLAFTCACSDGLDPEGLSSDGRDIKVITLTTEEDTPLTIDIDIALGAALTEPAHGTVEVLPPELRETLRVMYTPEKNFNGTDEFVASFSTAEQEVQRTVSITITAVDDPLAFSNSPPNYVAVGETFVYLPEVADADEPGSDKATYTFSIDNKPSWATFESETGALFGTASMADLGPVDDITLTATTDNGLKAVLTFALTISPTWKDVAVSTTHTVALRNDGTLWVWGSNLAKQLGTQEGYFSAIPAQLTEKTDWARVFAFVGRTLALDSTGALWLWGDGDAKGRQLDVGEPIKTMSMGRGQFWFGSYFLTADGALWTQKLVSNTSAPTEVPLPENLNIAKLAGASALGTDGTLWRLNAATMPTQIGTRTDWVNISSSYNNTVLYHYGVRTDGSVWVWDGAFWSVIEKLTIIEQPTRTLSRIAARVAGGGPNYMLQLGAEDGTLMGLGENRFGLLREPEEASPRVTTLQAVGNPLQRWRQLAVAKDHAAAIAQNGTLWLWGSGAYGQLGDGRMSASVAPNSDQNLICCETWSAVATMPTGGYATQKGDLWLFEGLDTPKTDWLLKTGDVTAVSGFYYLRTNGTLSTRDTAQLGYSTSWLSISAGPKLNMGVQSDGSLWGWGNSSMGILPIDKADTPVQLGETSDWLTADADGHVLAIKQNGALWAWGFNGNGQVGVGTNQARVNDPTQVGTDTDWVQVHAGDNFSVALKSDGSLWTWGSNNLGQLGDPNLGEDGRTTPGKVGSSLWSTITVGDTWAYGIKRDGSMWRWGAQRKYYNYWSWPDDASMTPVRPDKTWTDVSTSSELTLALDSSARLWNWGIGIDARMNRVVFSAEPTRIDQEP